MPIRYVPIFRWKRGERVGLQHLQGAAKARCQPIFLLGTDQFKPKSATKTKAAIPAPAHFVQEVAKTWGASAFALDASTLPVPGGNHPFVTVAGAARAAGLHLVPATNLGAQASYQAAVAAVAQMDNHGVCLRIDLQEAASATNWVPQWPHAPAQTDIVIDFGEGIAQAIHLGSALTAAVANLHLGPQWRSVTIAGTSMPPNFGGIAAGLHRIPRAEYALWQQLSGAGLPFQLDYGDFASVSPGVPPSNIAWGYPINVRYTLPNDFLICRGVRTDGPLGVDMDVQLVQHANSIVGYANRGPLGNCWADDTIDQIAAGAIGPQGLEHWVQLGVNRHVELMAAILP